MAFRGDGSLLRNLAAAGEEDPNATGTSLLPGPRQLPASWPSWCTPRFRQTPGCKSLPRSSQRKPSSLPSLPGSIWQRSISIRRFISSKSGCFWVSPRPLPWPSLTESSAALASAAGNTWRGHQLGIAGGARGCGPGGLQAWGFPGVDSARGRVVGACRKRRPCLGPLADLVGCCTCHHLVVGPPGWGCLGSRAVGACSAEACRTDGVPDPCCHVPWFCRQRLDLGTEGFAVQGLPFRRRRAVVKDSRRCGTCLASRLPW